MKSSLSSSSLLSSSTFTGSVTVGVERMFNYLMPFHSLHRLLAECVCVCVCLSLLHHFSTSSVYLLLALRLLLDLSTSPHITSFSILSSGILHYMTEEIQLLLHDLLSYVPCNTTRGHYFLISNLLLTSYVQNSS